MNTILEALHKLNEAPTTDADDDWTDDELEDAITNDIPVEDTHYFYAVSNCGEATGDTVEDLIDHIAIAAADAGISPDFDIDKGDENDLLAETEREDFQEFLNNPNENEFSFITTINVWYDLDPEFNDSEDDILSDFDTYDIYYRKK